MIEVDVDTWPRVELHGVTYAVSSRYVGPMSIGEAAETAAHHGCELPTPALVDAIWSAADCKLDARQFMRRHDGTARTMSSPEVMVSQAKMVNGAIEDWIDANGYPSLVAGCFKDVVRTESGKFGLYGWHRLDGRVIQTLYTGHSRAWGDYSQGLRLVRRIFRLPEAA